MYIFSLVMLLLSVHEFIPYFCCRNWQPTLPEKLFIQEKKYWGVKLPFYLLHPI